MPSIPSPEYITEIVEGAVYELPGGTVLVAGQTPDALAAFTPLLRGRLVVRYGIPRLMPSSEVVIPGLMAGERGGFLVGREAWDFMTQRFQMFPRADVVGLRANGDETQVFIRELDFGAPVRVFVYKTPEARTPEAEVKALIVGALPPSVDPETGTQLPGALPPLLSEHLPLADLQTLLQDR